jgi:hypothetical protein
MSNVAIAHGAPAASFTEKWRSPTQQAYQILHLGFVAAPLIAGTDKFFHLLADWDKYVPPVAQRILGGTWGTHAFMYVVGLIEVAAALLVAFRPRIGAYVVAAWLVAIIGALVLNGQYFDIALRDFGLLLAALALGRLSTVHGTAVYSQ